MKSFDPASTTKSVQKRSVKNAVFLTGTLTALRLRRAGRHWEY